MKMKKISTMLLSLVLVGALGTVSQRSAYAGKKAPGREEIKKKAFACLQSRQATPGQMKAFEAIWAGDDSLPVLDCLVASLAVVDERSRELVELCSQRKDGLVLPECEWLFDEEVPSFIRNNMRLYYGRWLVREALYEEAVDQLSGLSAEEVADPARLLFFRSAAYHRLLQKSKMNETIAELGRVSDMPLRYRRLADLMQDDLGDLKEDSLAYLAREMADVKRELWHGRTGTRIRTKEEIILAKLDKIIESMEQQMESRIQANNSPAPPSEGQRSPGPPMPGPPSGHTNVKGPAADSGVPSVNVDGEVDDRPIGRRNGWGDLADRARDTVRHGIAEAMPVHYGTAYEKYIQRMMELEIIPGNR